MKIISLAFFVVFLFNTLSSQVLTPAIDSIPLRDGKKLAADVYLGSAEKIKKCGCERYFC